MMLDDGKDDLGLPWLAERCKSDRCKGRRVTVGFSVSDEDWKAVVGETESILCLSCFDEIAQMRGVTYTILGLFPVTWTG